MANHPNRSTRAFRFIAYSMVTQNSLAHAGIAAQALLLAKTRLTDEGYFEVLDCGSSGRKIWDAELPLWKARAANITVYRGDGYEPRWPPVEMEV